MLDKNKDHGGISQTGPVEERSAVKRGNNWSPNQTPNKQKWQKIVLRPSSDSQKQEIVVSSIIR